MGSGIWIPPIVSQLSGEGNSVHGFLVARWATPGYWALTRDPELTRGWAETHAVRRRVGRPTVTTRTQLTLLQCQERPTRRIYRQFSRFR